MTDNLILKYPAELTNLANNPLYILHHTSFRRGSCPGRDQGGCMVPYKGVYGKGFRFFLPSPVKSKFEIFYFIEKEI